jgi:hypothetical protein
LAITVCPYCNINFFAEVSSRSDPKKQLLILEMDHYYKKSTYPWFSMSFFNLVPSCLICNQRLKGKADVALSSHLHPYADSFHQLVKFSALPDLRFFDSNIEKIEIEYRSTPECARTKETIRLYRLRDLYQYFIHEVEHIREEYRKRVMDLQREPLILGKGEQQIQLKIEESDLNDIQKWHRIPRNELEIRQFTLGKLKFDIYQELAS